MRPTRVLWLPVALAAMVAASSQASAGDWGTLANISSTMGANANRLCVGEGTRPSDIGCPTYAPSVTTAGDLTVSGSVTANSFIGDGSGLTNIAGASADRIVSGTTSMLAISNTGYISITQAGTNTGWFDPSRGLVTIGVSSTGGISGTTGYFSGNVGIGTASPSATLSIEQTGFPVLQASRNFTGDASTFRSVASFVLKNTTATASDGFGPNIRFDIIDNVTGPDITMNNGYLGQIGMVRDGANNSGAFIISTNSAGSVYERLRINSSGNVGIGTTTPTTALEVSGTISATNFIGNGSGLTGVVASASPAGPSGSIQFNLNGSSTSGSTAFVIQNGNVGIGTPAPSNKLHILGGTSTGITANTQSAIIVEGGTDFGNGNVNLSVLHGSGKSSALVFGDPTAATAGQVGYLSSNNNLYFATQATQRMTIISTGEVGIGTAAPTANLDVSGTASISGTLALRNTGSETCGPSTYNTLRINPGTNKLEICRP